MSTTQFLGASAAAIGFVAVILVLIGMRAVRRRRLVGGLITGLTGLCCGLLAALFGLILAGTRGYRALIHEEVAVEVWMVQEADQAFIAHFDFPDGTARTFRLQGDELYVDAHVLKWKPIANVLGLHTAYELDRVAGRYAALEDERSREKTLYSLAAPKPVDLFHLRRSSTLLAPLVDAEYGSATFVAAGSDTTRWELRISTTGLLIREAD